MAAPTPPAQEQAQFSIRITAIHQLQLRQAHGAGLDDFTRIAVDSTAVEAASAWPTDSKTILDLCARFLVGEMQLSALGYRHGAMVKAEKWLEQLSGFGGRGRGKGWGRGRTAISPL
jgi:hypothetical protein